MIRIRIVSILFLMVMFAATALIIPGLAQTSGQFCVRAFEDRTGNGQIDAGEPVITRGIGANLLDSRGVIIQTALLDNSPTSAQGVICFQNLAAGQYTMEITSAEYNPTTINNLTVNITDDPQTLTTVFEFGGQRLDALSTAGSTADSDEIDRAAIERVLVATVGALIAMIGSAMIGLFYYLLLLRGRHQRMRQAYPQGYYDPRYTTGSMRTVEPSNDTGEWRRYE